jgi:hypothetical protein
MTPEIKTTSRQPAIPRWLRQVVRRLKCASGKHEMQIQFTNPSGKIIAGQLSCVTCEHCGGKWATCLEDRDAPLIPFWTLYSAEDEIAMREENDQNGIA